jgi:hypothetical protein
MVLSSQFLGEASMSDEVRPVLLLVLAVALVAIVVRAAPRAGATDALAVPATAPADCYDFEGGGLRAISTARSSSTIGTGAIARDASACGRRPTRSPHSTI